MKLFGPLPRSIALAGLLFLSMMVAAPTQAAKAEIDLLHSYIGTWTGNGVLVGANSERVRCRLTLSPGNQDKVNYSGRCAMAGTNLSVNGTLAYIDASRRYEAAMTSNAQFSGLAVGQRTRSGVIFNLRERNTDAEGNDMTVTARIALQDGRIGVEFNVVFNATGDTLKATVPFSR
jgi:hypothetical protein